MGPAAAEPLGDGGLSFADSPAVCVLVRAKARAATRVARSARAIAAKKALW